MDWHCLWHVDWNVSCFNLFIMNDIKNIDIQKILLSENGFLVLKDLEQEMNTKLIKRRRIRFMGMSKLYKRGKSYYYSKIFSGNSSLDGDEYSIYSSMGSSEYFIDETPIINGPYRMDSSVSSYSGHILTRSSFYSYRFRLI